MLVCRPLLVFAQQDFFGTRLRICRIFWRHSPKVDQKVQQHLQCVTLTGTSRAPRLWNRKAVWHSMGPRYFSPTVEPLIAYHEGGNHRALSLSKHRPSETVPDAQTKQVQKCSLPVLCWLTNPWDAVTEPLQCCMGLWNYKQFKLFTKRGHALAHL